MTRSTDIPLEKFCIDRMTPLDESQTRELQHIIGNGLTPIVNYLHLISDSTEQEKQNYVARCNAAIDALRERLKKECGI